MTKHPTVNSLSRGEFIGIIAALMALNSLAIDIMLPALPYIGQAFDIHNPNNNQYVISSYMLGYGIGEIIFGPISDRYGRRDPLLIGVYLYVAACICTIFCPTFGAVLVARLLQGLGAASTRVVAASIVRDRYSGHAMAQVMSLTIMLFMVIPILAPGFGQLLLSIGPWQLIFVFMALFGVVVAVWARQRLPETLATENRRELTVSAVLEAFLIVLRNRQGICYGLAGTFMFASLFGFLASAQQIYVGIYHLGNYFPLAFAGVAALMAIASFSNSRMVKVIGMRRLSHAALLLFTITSGVLLVFALSGEAPFWLFLTLLAIVMSCFGWAAANMNSLSMLPLGAIAGTASSVFGFIQTVGGVIIGSAIGQLFDGTIVPVTSGYLAMGVLSIVCVLVAERGSMFGRDDFQCDTAPQLNMNSCNDAGGCVAGRPFSARR